MFKKKILDSNICYTYIIVTTTYETSIVNFQALVPSQIVINILKKKRTNIRML